MRSTLLILLLLWSAHLSAEPARVRKLEAIHILSNDCACALKLIKHLIQRGRQPEIEESALIINGAPAWQRDLEEAGIRSTLATPEDIVKELPVYGSPWLVVREPSGAIIYSGGYSKDWPDKEQDYLDLEIFKAIKANQKVESLPWFGCTEEHWRKGTH